ncbi:MAG: hypothetical protein K9J37_16165 [Saprospiraceae bacterium]|nr:hypothetical protein [Saprospiraceae bacterium]MCF8251449.1 hypothetical protein [Saprospiraceae bacterium]MCF8282241.1 hypothetical protein [Bacteroidales bacterium]MCF8441491.1 hypothetical protein [Saprospiraceae bacterium]
MTHNLVGFSLKEFERKKQGRPHGQKPAFCFKKQAFQTGGEGITKLNFGKF